VARDIEATLLRNGESVRVRVAAVRAGSTLSVDGVEVEGDAGSLHASVQRGPGSLSVRARGVGLDVSRLITLAGPTLVASLGPDAASFGGVVDLDTDVVITPRSAQGRASLDARNVSIPLATGVALHGVGVSTQVTLDGRAVTVAARAEGPDLGSVTLSTADLVLGGSALDAASYRKATGSATLATSLDLAQLAALVPAERRPLTELGGTATVTLTASRSIAARTPDLTIDARTRDLVVETRGDAGPGTRVTGIDLVAAAAIDGKTERVKLDVTATDAHGVLAAMHADAFPTLTAILATPTEARARLLATAFQARLDVPARQLGELPSAALGGMGDSLSGTVSLVATASGTARDPSVTIEAKSVGFSAARGLKSPMELQLDATFAKGRGSATLDVSSQGRSVVDATADGALELADLLDGREGGPRWTAGGEVVLSALPLRELTALAGQPITGCASGRIVLRGLHEDARLDADVQLASLRVGAVEFSDARLTAHAGTGAATFEARLTHGDGSLIAKGDAGLTWGADLAPTLAPARPTELSLLAKDFRLSTLRPFVREQLGNVDGRLSADVTYRSRDGTLAVGEAEGHVTVREGVLDAPAVGQELRGIQATVEVSKSGEVHVRDASARGITGRVSVEATAHLDGLMLRDASAKLRISKREAMIVAYEGVGLGTAWGDVNVSATRDPAGVVDITVSVPTLDFELPDYSSRSLQSLDPAPTIRIGTTPSSGGNPPRFVLLPIHGPLREPEPATPAGSPPASSLHVQVVLGRQVRVHHAGKVDAWASGKLVVSAGSQAATVSGAIQVQRGFVELQGRRFEIEQVTATFDPSRPPGDPTVSAKATYEAPDGTIVIAEFLGTAEKGKLELRSEPALSQAEILSLVVFGSREAGAGQSTGAQAAAAGVGGAVLTQGLNKALSDVSPLEVTTRLDTTDAQDPRPEVGVALSRKVTATVSYRLGIPTPGQPQDRSTLRLDYRFLPRWTFETSVGDRGTSILDVMWKLRY
jgi:translocation and assembly module TamB